MSARDRAASQVTQLVFGEGQDRVCHDIPESACVEQPRNISIHVASLTATKTGDGLLDPKLVLAWLVDALGGSAAAVGALVPIRESLALLGQLFIGHRIRRLAIRKNVWAMAAAAQGCAVIGIAVTSLTMPAPTSIWAILALLAVFAIARSFASVSYKDVLGKTVSKRRRGSVTGTAASVSSVLILAFGGGLAAGLIPVSVTAIATAILAGGVMWLLAAALFTRLEEEPGATEGGVDGTTTALGNLTLLVSDRQLGRFVVARSLLTVTAVAPPFLLQSVSDGDGRALGDLGPFVVASGLATIVGGRLWGRLSDRSSRKVLMGAALASSGLFVIAAAGSVGDAGFLRRPWAVAGLLFLVVLAYQGVRLGRSTHLVDMARADRRSVYTAVSNTTVGVVILAAAGFGPLSELLGLAGLFAVFATMSLLALVAAAGLDEVQSV